MNREVWAKVRANLWSIICILDDHYALPHIGAKRAKE
jgi:hypothetical protein